MNETEGKSVPESSANAVLFPTRKGRWSWLGEWPLCEALSSRKVMGTSKPKERRTGVSMVRGTLSGPLCSCDLVIPTLPRTETLALHGPTGMLWLEHQCQASPQVS